MPAAQITRVVPEAECAFSAVFRGFEESTELRAGQIERAFNQFDRYLTDRSDDLFG